MSNKLRSVNTKLWEKPWIEELSPKDKLLFIYLLTNSKTNMLGIYEVSVSKMSFETGLTKTEIKKAFEGFQTLEKVYYINNYVLLPNFLQNQSLNSNMKISALKEYDKLPNSLKSSISMNASEGFESLCKGFEMLSKVEVEDEREYEKEGEGEKQPPKVDPLPAPILKVYRKFKHLSLSQDEFEKLKSEGYSEDAIDSILDSIENHSGNKKYSSMILTARSWLKRDKKNPLPQANAKKSNDKFPISLKTASYEELKKGLS